MGGEKTRVTGPIQIDFQQILGEVETTTSKIHAWISAQPIIEDNQGAKYMYMYWDGTSELQTLHNELCLSQQRMATFAAAMSKNDKRSNSAYAEAAQAITMAQLYLVSADLEKIADPENPAMVPAQILRPNLDLDDPMGAGEQTPAGVAADNHLETGIEEDQVLEVDVHIHEDEVDMICRGVELEPLEPPILNDLRDRLDLLYHMPKEVDYPAAEDVEMDEKPDTPPEEEVVVSNTVRCDSQSDGTALNTQTNETPCEQQRKLCAACGCLGHVLRSCRTQK